MVDVSGSHPRSLRPTYPVRGERLLLRPLAKIAGDVLDHEPPGYRRWLTRAMSLSVSEACAGLGEETFSGVVLIM